MGQREAVHFSCRNRFSYISQTIKVVAHLSERFALTVSFLSFPPAAAVLLYVLPSDVL